MILVVAVNVDRGAFYVEVSDLSGVTTRKAYEEVAKVLDETDVGEFYAAHARAATLEEALRLCIADLVATATRHGGGG